MCKDCGCDVKTKNESKTSKANMVGSTKSDPVKSSSTRLNQTKEVKVILNKSVTDDNDRIAHEIAHKLADMKIFCVNLMGSPGSGKTTVIEHIADIMGKSKLAVIQGDLESDVDKKRLEKAGIMTYQINTHSGCHLNAEMIDDALRNFKIKGKEYLIIENVGNLVCPVGVKIGQHMNMVVSSTTEGSDKPKKYPGIFMESKLIVVSKYDLAEHVDFDSKMYLDDINKINGKATIIKVSKKKPKTFGEVVHYIEHQREHLLDIDHGHHHH